jgi:hypothetical protein
MGAMHWIDVAQGQVGGSYAFDNELSVSMK